MLANKTILQHKYTRIVRQFAEKLRIPYDKALCMFYDSKTFELISEGVADMHCMSDEYLVDELVAEYNTGT